MKQALKIEKKRWKYNEWIWDVEEYENGRDKSEAQ